MLKLNFGCGGRLESGWTGVDIRPLPGVKYVCNFWEIPVEADSVHAIYCRHALEHVTFANAERTLAKFHEILRQGKEAHIIVPDLSWHAAQLLGEVKGNHRRGDLKHALAGFYGWQDGGEESIHRSGWTYGVMLSYLKKAGFLKIKINTDSASHLEARVIK